MGDETIGDPETLLRERWTDSPYSLGTYCTPGLNSDEDTFRQVSSPLPSEANPRLLFAGEATSSTQWSFLHGAQRTGIAAANLIISSIQRP